FLLGHEDVGDDDRRTACALHLQAVRAVRRALRLDAVDLEPQQGELAEIVVVVDDEDACHVLLVERRNGFYSEGAVRACRRIATLCCPKPSHFLRSIRGKTLM